MKIKNIVFFGFAAAILSSAAHADPIPFQIASKAYVDGLIGENGTMTADVTALKEAVGGANDGLVKDVADLQGDVSDLETAVGSYNAQTGEGSGLLKDVADLETAVEAKASSSDLTALANRVTANENKIGTGAMSVGGTQRADIVTAINALDAKTDGIATQGNLETLQGSVTTLSNAVGSYNDQTGQGSGLLKDVADLQSDVAGKASSSDVTTLAGRVTTAEGDIDALEGTMGNAALTTTAQTVTGAVNELKTAVDSKANANDVYTKSQLDTMIGAKLDHPATNTCSATSGHCVLSLDNNGNLTWVDITAPFAVIE